MRAVHDAAVSLDGTAREPRLELPEAIDAAVELTLPEIGEGRLGVAPRHAIGDPLARPASVEPEDEPRPRPRAAIPVRIDAEAPVIAVHHRRMRVGMVKAGIPHQRAITENPDITALSERRRDLRIVARRWRALAHACFASMIERRIPRVRVKRSSSFWPSPQ